jgi:hypothetical protein
MASLGVTGQFFVFLAGLPCQPTSGHFSCCRRGIMFFNNVKMRLWTYQAIKRSPWLTLSCLIVLTLLRGFIYPAFDVPAAVAAKQPHVDAVTADATIMRSGETVEFNGPVG